MEGKVVHASSRGVGIEFKEVDPTVSQILPAIFELIG
jgi:hypothetical protein